MTSHPHKRHANQVVTRFAPSPTGYMHVGGVRTALFAWAFARKHGKDGTFILRIEDTDKEREVEGSIGHIIESLKWLGINWDEGPDIGGDHGPYIQSERLDTYRQYTHILIDKGLAYADPYSQEELEAFRKKAEEEKRPFLYRDHRPENPPQWIDEDGKRVPLRLRISDEMIAAGQVKWNDLVRGELSAGPESLDDFILIKSDGYPTYNFAHIIDDLLMGVTHVCRADEFISSTPKFLALYEALEIERPLLAVLPPIMSPDGKKKLGKRDGAKDILAYRAEGYLPEAVLNFLAFIGWNPGDEREIMSAEEIIEAFDFAKVQSAGGKLNEDKLIWTNREYLVRMSDDMWLEKFFHYLNNDALDLKKKFADRGIDVESDTFKRILIEVVRERLSYFGEVNSMIDNREFDYFFASPLDNPEADGVATLSNFKKLLICPEKMWKNGAGEKIEIDSVSTSSILNQVGEILERHTDDWSKEKIKDALWPFAEHEGRGVVLWPLRVALSGAERSPDPFILAGILEKKETLERIRAAIEVLG
jgi:glutamyl-tRNA synthetase